MLRDVLLPKARFVGKRRVVHAVLAPAHLKKAGLKIFQKIILKRTVPAGIAQSKIAFKAGMMNGRCAVDYGVVMVKDKAFISHVYLAFYNIIINNIASFAQNENKKTRQKATQQ